MPFQRHAGESALVCSLTVECPEMSPGGAGSNPVGPLLATRMVNPGKARYALALPNVGCARRNDVKQDRVRLRPGSVEH